MQDKSGSTSPKSICIDDDMCVDVRTPMNGQKLKEAVYEHAIKVRKPYTITKQRERWTDEEHEKFLEALKLYSRSWRQIEEHIGTKTAVQIRSHAQKFFSKVVRESADDGLDSVKAIEIPPPRPKRKPIHPYPRKLGNSSSMKMPVLEQPEWSSLSIPTTSEQENQSPMSVLTALRSDTMGSSMSNIPSGCTSPVSSVAGSNQVVMFLTDDNRSPSPGSASTGLTMQEKSTMELNLGKENHVSLEDDSSIETQATSLRLFGRTLLVTNTQKPSSSDEKSMQCPKPLHTTGIHSHSRSMDVDVQTTDQSALQSTAGGDFSATLGNGSCGSWPGGVSPMFFCLPSHGHGDPATAAAGAAVVSLPWLWAFCGGLPSQSTNVNIISSNHDPCQSCGEAADAKDIQQEGSWSGSNTASAGDAVDSQSAGRKCEPAPSYSLWPSANSAFSSPKACTPKTSRGFVPYRRCLAEKAVQNSLIADEDGDSQGIKLCL